MKIDFYQKEVKKAQQRFNQIFGTQVVCNIEERQLVIMAICWLGVLNIKIKENAESAELVREFTKYRNIINKYFNHKERRFSYVECTPKRAVSEDTQVI